MGIGILHQVDINDSGASKCEALFYLQKDNTIGIKGVLEVIEILYNHCNVDDYYMISSIEVMIEDQAEKE